MAVLLVLGFQLFFSLGRGRAASAADVVFLDVRATRETAATSLLVRELARQALLIAARDELGLFTRDASLRERPPQGANVESTALDLAVVEGTDGQVQLRLTKGSTRPVLLNALGVKRPDVSTIPALTTQLESLSRTELVNILKGAGYSKRSIEPASAAEVPEALAVQLTQWSCLTQFAAVRSEPTAEKCCRIIRRRSMTTSVR